MTDEDKKLDLDDTSKNENQEEDKDESWKDNQKVPYRRFEEVGVKVNRKVDDLSAKLDTFINSFKESGTKKNETRSQGVWDKKIKSAESWDEVFAELPKTFLTALKNDPEFRSEFVNSIKNDFKKEETEAEAKVTKEIESLYDKGVITTKKEENAVINYAIKESEESGEYIPLNVAVRMMKKEGVWGKTIENREEANKKVNKGQSQGDKEDKTKTPYKSFRRDSLDDIVVRRQREWDEKK